MPDIRPATLLEGCERLRTGVRFEVDDTVELRFVGALPWLAGAYRQASHVDARVLVQLDDARRHHFARHLSPPPPIAIRVAFEVC